MAFFEFPHTRTYDSDLGWLIKQVHTNEEAIAVLDNWIAEYQPRIEDLEACCRALYSGDLPEAVANGIIIWLKNHAFEWMSAIIQNVWFGLTDTGYFVAYVPESWDDITFKTTGLDIILDLMPEYGHLVLQY